MSYQQVRPFDQAKGGTTPNFCLANVTAGYSIANKYSSAWEAWEHTQQHGGDAPAGLDVPVYFSYSATIDGVYANWGHIGVRLANGTFWSDGKVYSSISAYTATHSPKYVGWGESVNDAQVIKQGEDEPMVDNAHLNALTLAYFNRGPLAEESARYNGKATYARVIEDFDKSDEYARKKAADAAAYASGVQLQPGKYIVN